MIKLPLRYSDRVFAHALIDDDAEPLTTLGYYSVSLPRNLRHMAGKRPDVILAHLREDPLTVHKCTPFVSLFGTQVLLVHLVMRASLARLVLQADEFSPGSKFEIRSDINEIRSAIGRIAYANGDRTDCRSDNIRELL
jgi:hypothetical protein